ncbi:MAG: type secretion protein family, partial [Proteobacteria bacterium]|nr:type secretion protein family [Pseudomonadota bacterium]
VIGARVWARQFKFRVMLGPLDLAQYQALLPGGPSLSELVAIVRNYAGDELSWDVNLILRHDEVPALNLDGSAQLGWTTWMGDRRDATDAADLLLNPFFGDAQERH